MGYAVWFIIWLVQQVCYHFNNWKFRIFSDIILCISKLATYTELSFLYWIQMSEWKIYKESWLIWTCFPKLIMYWIRYSKKCTNNYKMFFRQLIKYPERSKYFVAISIFMHWLKSLFNVSKLSKYILRWMQFGSGFETKRLNILRACKSLCSGSMPNRQREVGKPGKCTNRICIYNCNRFRLFHHNFYSYLHN